VVPMVAEQGAAVSARFGGVYLDVLRTLRLSPSRLIRRLAWELPGTVEVTPAPTDLEVDPVATVTRALELADQLADGFFVFVAVLLLAFYWTLERERILRSALLLAPLNRRDGLRELFEAAEEKVGGYVRGVSILSLIIGGLALAVYAVLGVPYALLLAIVAGIMEAVPVVGPALGVLPAFIVTLAVDPTRALWVVAAFAGIQLLENVVLVPRVMGRTVGVNPVVTLLALLGFGTLFGTAGAVLAIPLAAVVQLLLDRYVLGPAAVEQQEPEGRGRLSVLRLAAQELMQDVRKRQREKSEGLDDQADEVEDAIEALAADVDSFLARNAPNGTVA
jgi:predicted PurR-regulated permease PerM